MPSYLVSRKVRIVETYLVEAATAQAAEEIVDEGVVSDECGCCSYVTSTGKASAKLDRSMGDLS